MTYVVRDKNGTLKFTIPNAAALQIVERNIVEFEKKQLTFGETNCSVITRSFNIVVGRNDTLEGDGYVMYFFKGDYMHKE